MVRHFRVESPIILVSGLVWLMLAAFLIGPPTGPLEASSSSDTLTITRAELDRGRLRVEGENAGPGATVSVDGVSMGNADAEGRFRVEADGFDSASCQVTVSDGVSSVLVSLDGCDPTADPPPADPPPGGDLVITRAEMNGGRVRIEGQGAQPDATIRVDEVALGGSDAQGDFRVAADGFGSASCQVTVSDGVNSAGASLDGCTPTAPPPAVDPVMLTLTSTGVIAGASGEADLALGFVPDLGVNGLLANAEAQGLTPNVSFSMCVDATFIDDDQSITGTDLTFDEGVESSLVSLSGLTVTIRQDIGCDGTLVLQGTVP